MNQRASIPVSRDRQGSGPPVRGGKDRDSLFHWKGVTMSRWAAEFFLGIVMGAALMNSLILFVLGK